MPTCGGGDACFELLKQGAISDWAEEIDHIVLIVLIKSECICFVNCAGGLVCFLHERLRGLYVTAVKVQTVTGAEVLRGSEHFEPAATTDIDKAGRPAEVLHARNAASGLHMFDENTLSERNIGKGTLFVGVLVLLVRIDHGVENIKDLIQRFSLLIDGATTFGQHRIKRAGFEIEVSVNKGLKGRPLVQRRGRLAHLIYQRMPWDVVWIGWHGACFNRDIRTLLNECRERKEIARCDPDFVSDHADGMWVRVRALFQFNGDFGDLGFGLGGDLVELVHQLCGAGGKGHVKPALKRKVFK